MSLISRTIVSIPSLNATYEWPGDQSADTIKAAYAGSVAGIASMTVVETSTGDSKTLTFSQPTGTKGAGGTVAEASGVTSTVISIPSLNATYTWPGDQSADTIKAAYAGSVAGINAMTAVETTNGNVKTITFNQPTGTKGVTA